MSEECHDAAYGARKAHQVRMVPSSQRGPKRPGHFDLDTFSPEIRPDRRPVTVSTTHPFASPPHVGDAQLRATLSSICTLSDKDLARYRSQLAIPNDLPIWRLAALRDVAYEYRRRGYSVTDLIQEEVK